MLVLLWFWPDFAGRLAGDFRSRNAV